MTVTTPAIKTPNTADLLRYAESVESLFRMQSSQPISNSLQIHAAIVLEKFFRHAKQHVRIFSLHLCAPIFGNKELFEAARRAVEDRNIKVSVVTQEAPQPTEFLSFLEERAQKSQNILFLRARGPAVKFPMRFAVMDLDAVRVEVDDHDGNPVAHAVMTAPDYAMRLVRTFDEMVLQSAPARPSAATPQSIAVQRVALPKGQD